MHGIRYFGILANGCRATMLRCAGEALGTVGCAAPSKTADGPEADHEQDRDRGQVATTSVVLRWGRRDSPAAGRGAPGGPLPGRYRAPGGGDPAGQQAVPVRLRRDDEDRRGPQRAARHRAGAVRGDRDGSSALRLQPVQGRRGGPGAGPGFADRGRPADRGSCGAFADRQVRPNLRCVCCATSEPMRGAG